MTDFLDEDAEIRNQKYCVLSYTLPDPKRDTKGKQKVGFDTPMVKVRGSYSTVEECEARVEKLKADDKYFHMYVAPVGQWGPLLTEDQQKEVGTNSVYMNREMNDFMKGYKDSQNRKNDAFDKRKNELAEKAKFEGTKEGQELLANQKENPVSVKNRIDQTSDMIKELQAQLKEAQDLHDSSVKLYYTYSQQEIEDAELKIKTDALKIQEL
jgi:hypothetical protein